jgi:low affinity Fe/Cu permease
MLANTFLKPSSAMSRRRHPPEFDCPWASLIEQVESVSKKSSWFSDFSGKAARAAGHPMAFVLVGGIVIVWLITGPLFGFSDTWQLVINTGSSIVTFLMVFLIQNTQNRDSAAIHIKLDELIRSIEGAHNALLNLEDLDQKELDSIRADYLKLARAAREKLQANRSGTPEVAQPEKSG